ncbi:MAG: flagellar filament capping protein FliD [Desulfobacterales bacterium]|nr:flagellar filament capping protein FliD [Desulfobacterales bacterium]
MMQITGSYNNYVNMTNLLAPLGARGSADLVMQVFSSAVGNLQDKINQQIFSEESDAAIKELYNEVSDLAGRAEKLTLTYFNSVFFDRTPTSSDSNVLTATAVDAFSLDSGAAEATYNISVNQLALAQENTGFELNAADPSVVNPGINTFNININGQDHELGIDVVDGDTNEVVLQKIVAAINDAGLGVTGEVTAGSLEGTQQLVITADQTGTAGSFTLSDVSGNAVTVTGTATVSTVAQDAAYTVDGTGYTSETNTIYLDSGLVTVNLKGAGESILTVAPDQNEVENAITAFVSAVNSIIDFLETNCDYIEDEVLSSVNSFVTEHKSELESFGVTIEEDGKLVVDTYNLATAVNDDLSGIKDAFAGFDGLAVQVKNYTARISTDSPLNYAKEAEGMSKDFVDYLYGTSATMLEKILQGMLLDTFV